MSKLREKFQNVFGEDSVIERMGGDPYKLPEDVGAVADFAQHEINTLLTTLQKEVEKLGAKNTMPKNSEYYQELVDAHNAAISDVLAIINKLRGEA